MPSLRRLLALSLAACAASPDHHVTLSASPPLDRLPPASPNPLPDPDPLPAPPPIPSGLPWQTGTQFGHGVAFKDTKNPAGINFFLGYAGYRVPLTSAETWVDALYDVSLAARGVRYVWAVQGPDDRTYAHREIGSSKIVATLLRLVEPDTRFVLVAGHSSGSFVAHELLAKLAGGMDPQGLTAGRVVYFDLDGGAGGLTTQSVGRLRRAYFVGAHDGKTATDSPRLGVMRSLGATFASTGGYWQYDASDAGCHAGAQWCVHDALKRHDWIDAKAAEAGLDP